MNQNYQAYNKHQEALVCELEAHLLQVAKQEHSSQRYVLSKAIASSKSNIQLSLEKEELDEQLKQLAKEAQHHPPRSLKRQIALTKLMNSIVHNRELCYPQGSQFPADIYQDICDEPLHELLLYVCQNIDKYESERSSVMTWVNTLRRRNDAD
ncbi:hypothetical protein [Iningainema tapete]|uniref:Uncharacterized protein n=1 Tax=Iningainema tapete BLCC-T55 TaxID=2748662 RepID=A0A8J7CHE4_9CYAN|nr:hypothetical protein [Iningainema tapete]MBD2777540.1 hypothetical protein [Iningainema tapete BLCC-T55]